MVSGARAQLERITREYFTNLDAMMIYRLDRFGRGGHHRPVYRPLLVYCWLQAFRSVYETLPRTGVGRTKLRIRNVPGDLRHFQFELTEMDVRSTRSRLVGNMTFVTGQPVLHVTDADGEGAIEVRRRMAMGASARIVGMAGPVRVIVPVRVVVFGFAATL